MTGLTSPDASSVRHELKVLLVDLRDEELHLLASHEPREPRRADMRQRPEPAVHRPADHDDRRVLASTLPELPERPAAGDVEHQVVTDAAPREVLARCSCRSRSAPLSSRLRTLFVLQTAVTSAPKCLASCTANDPTPPDAPLISTFWPGCTLPVVSKRLQRGERGDRDGSSLLERDVRGLRDEPDLAGGGVLRPGACAGTEHLVARLELGDVLADGDDAPGEVGADLRRLRPAQPVAEAREERPHHRVPLRRG